MTNSQIISKARGDKILVVHGWAAGIYYLYCPTCKRGIDTATKLTHCTRPDCKPPDYENDPGVWTPEFFKWIEGRGLHLKMCAWLILLMGDDGTMDTSVEVDSITTVFLDATLWPILKSTPAQKTEALVRALQEATK